MGVDEIYTAEVRRQQELAIVKEEAAYEQIQAAGGCLTKVLPNIVMHPRLQSLLWRTTFSQ